MQIGNMQEFRQQQLDKVRKRKEEEKKIKKGIYQMHAMIDSQCMETFDKEHKKVEEKAQDVKNGEGSLEGKTKENKKKDIQTEIEKMLATAAINIIHENNHSGGEFFARTVALTPKLIVRESSRIKL